MNEHLPPEAFHVEHRHEWKQPTPAMLEDGDWRVLCACGATQGAALRLLTKAIALIPVDEVPSMTSEQFALALLGTPSGRTLDRYCDMGETLLDIPADDDEYVIDHPDGTTRAGVYWVRRTGK